MRRSAVYESELVIKIRAENARLLREIDTLKYDIICYEDFHNTDKKSNKPDYNMDTVVLLQDEIYDLHEQLALAKERNSQLEKTNSERQQKFHKWEKRQSKKIVIKKRK